MQDNHGMSTSQFMRQERAKYERIDDIAMWLFPMFFFLFNVAYWSYYLLLFDIITKE